MKPTLSPKDQGWDADIINILKRLGSREAEYPAELWAARRAAFIQQVERQQKHAPENGLFPNGQFLRHLENLSTVRAEYPAGLLAARRARFVDQIERYQQILSTEASDPEEQEIARLFTSLKAVEPEYPAALLAARRAAFTRQLALGAGLSILEALRNALHSLLSYRLPLPSLNRVGASLVVLGLMLAALFGSLVRSSVRSFSPSLGGYSQLGHHVLTTQTDEPAKVICKPGYFPPLCLAREFDASQDLTLPGNGSARPAVAKDTLPGYHGVHKASYVNDGLYGPGASWISNSAYSWVKIDLGRSTTINTIAFGRDRLGKFNDRDPGQFVIAVALSDDVYVDGNSSNDHLEYVEVYDSDQMGFDGIVSGPETIRAEFRPVAARFIKITFANPGVAVDEIEAFLLRTSVLGYSPTRKPREGLPGVSPVHVPTKTALPVPTNTYTPVPVPTGTYTPVPVNTATPVPTNTPLPTDTAIPKPTDTPAPTDTPVPPVVEPPPATDTSIPATNMIEPFAAPTPTPVPLEP